MNNAHTYWSIAMDLFSHRSAALIAIAGIAVLACALFAARHAAALASYAL